MGKGTRRVSKSAYNTARKYASAARVSREKGERIAVQLGVHFDMRKPNLHNGAKL